MTRAPESSPLSAVKQSLLAIAQLQAKVDAAERARDEPIALVGIGCRFPRAGSPEAFWRLLVDGVDAVSEVPASRWNAETFYDPDPDAAGKMSSKWGGFLDDVDQFDAGFFGISAREAEALDPQQRVLLEVAWEALERAGLPAERLAGAPVGVFVSTGPSDYSHLAMMSDDWSHVDPYTSTGGAPAAASGRLSYVLGLHGPNFIVDSGCSSSLVAIHLACESLRRGESDVALAGGVNLTLSPYSTLVLSKLRALSSDGRTRAFDAAADGFVRGEGCGVVVLRRLGDALAARDPIVAVIRGSAINHGGAASGLTAPNAAAQTAVIRAALARAALAPERIEVVEAHGTGTALGDSIEVRALKEVFGGDRARPLWLGSVKTNLGHLEASAGIAGLIKVALMLQHRTIAPHLHFTQPHPNLALHELAARIPVRAEPWPRSEAPRAAGVSSFGVGGSNAHVVLEEAPEPVASASVPAVAAEQDRLLPLSARDAEALRVLARQTAEGLRHPSAAPLADLCYTASRRRSHHEHRLAVRGASATELADRLDGLARGEVPIGTSAGRSATSWRGLVFVFSGQGSQWLGMGRELLATAPAFATALHACDRAVQAHAGWSVLEELRASPERSRLERVEIAQPSLFAVQIALAALWRSWGIEPDAVLGHSMGEVAAAHVAGALSLDDAARVICRRSELFAQVSGTGAMLMAELTQAQAEALVLAAGEGVSIAAYNGPRATVLAGTRAALAAISTTLAGQGVFHRSINVPFASHCAEVDPVLPQLHDALTSITPGSAAVPLFSTVTGTFLAGTELHAGYWVRNARQPVRFAQSVVELATSGYLDFLEIGPHPSLTATIAESLVELGLEGSSSPSLRRSEPELAAMLDGLGAFYAAGRPVDWTALHGDGGACVPLPSYPWRRRRHFSAAVTSTLARLNRSPLDEAFFEVAWRPRSLPPVAGATDAAAASNARRPTRWVVLLDGEGLGEAVRGELARRGQQAIAIGPASGFDARSELAWSALLTEERAAGAPIGVIDLSALALRAAAGEDEAPSLEAALSDFTAAALAQLRALAGQSDADVTVWKVTRGVHSASGQRAGDAQAVAWGLGRSLASEHPESWGGLIDLEAGEVDRAAAQLADELLAGVRREQVAYRQGLRHVARLARRPAPPVAAPLALRRDGCYLVTGGLGGLGLEVARWLAERGAGAVALLGRGGLPARASWGALAPTHPAHRAVRAVEQIEALGCRALLLQADVADAAALRLAWRQLEADAQTQVRGVVHCAGALGDGVLTEQDWPKLRAALAPKVLGGHHLDELIGARPLDFFVLFAAGAGLLGPPGQAGYAAANTYLDALAQRRRARGQVALAVDWGLFRDVGLAVDEHRGHRLAARGLGSMTPAQGLAALDRLLAGDPPAQVAVMPIDWPRWAASYPEAATAPFLEEVVPTAGAREPAAPALAAASIQALAPAARRAALLQLVGDLVRRALRLGDGAEIDPGAALNRLGLDSLMALEIRSRLQRQTGVRVSTALLLQGASADAVVAELEQQLGAAELLDRVGGQPRTSTTDDPQLEVVTL
jgi:acyl transferase domain-containing protein/acyl carrier protein